MPRLFLTPALARWALVAVSGGMLSSGGCRTAPEARTSAAPPSPSESGMQVEKVREEVRVTPWDLVFSGVRGKATLTESVTARNMVDRPVEIRAVRMAGPQAASFGLMELPQLPFTLAPKASVSWQVSFAPGPEAATGVHRALLRVQTGAEPDDGPAVDVAALVLRGEQGDNEPPLQHVVEALGFSVDVGGPTLSLGTGADPIGEEVRAPRFRRANPAPVAMNPVARFSPVEPLPFGYYQAGEGAPKLETLATISAQDAQKLNPDLEPGGQTSFDPGKQPFGLWVRSGKHVTHTEDQRNTGATKHAVRVYPLKSRGGAPVANAFLVAFEEAANGDYQDYVFLLWNVQPAP